MGRTEILNKIQEGLDRMEKWHINTFQCDERLMNGLNPAFGFSPKATTSGLNSRGVQSVWMGGGARRLTVHLLPGGYGRAEKNLNTENLTDGQLAAISNMVDGLCKEELESRKRGMKNPVLKDLLPIIEAWAKKCTEAASKQAAGKNYSAFVSYGKRAYDRQKYYAVLIMEDNDQIGSISLVQDKEGRLWYNERAILGGEWDRDRILQVKDLFQPIKESVEHLTGKRFSLQDAEDKSRLYKKINEKNGQWSEEGMTFNLKVRNENGVSDEKWKIEFLHDFSKEKEVGVKMMGTRLDGENNAPVELSEGIYIPDSPATGLMMESQGIYMPVVRAMEEVDGVELIDEMDIPGQERWAAVDVKELYDKYLRNMNRTYFFSPAADIRNIVFEDPGYDYEEKDHLRFTCLASIFMDDKVLDEEEARLLKKIHSWPEYTFLEQQAVHREYSDVLDQFYADARHLSDIVITKNGEKPCISCKIDGEQQMRKNIPAIAYDNYIKAEDKESVSLWLASLKYREELKGQVLNTGLKR